MSGKKKKKDSFLGIFKKWFLWALIILVLLYIAVYLCFRWNGFISVGIDLEKKDWLSFLGSYLSFGGTVVVSAIAILQSHYYTTIQNKRDEEERRKSVQPIFSIEIAEINTGVSGTAEVFNPSKAETIPVHRNFTLKIENVGAFPIRTVIIFDKYQFQLLKPNDPKSIQIAYWDSPDIKKWKSKLIEITDSDYERTDIGLPKWFNINYDDVDGHEMYQSFQHANFDGVDYYSLDETQEI